MKCFESDFDCIDDLLTCNDIASEVKSLLNSYYTEEAHDLIIRPGNLRDACEREDYACAVVKFCDSYVGNYYVIGHKPDSVHFLINDVYVMPRNHMIVLNDMETTNVKVWLLYSASHKPQKHHISDLFHHGMRIPLNINAMDLYQVYRYDSDIFQIQRDSFNATNAIPDEQFYEEYLSVAEQLINQNIPTETNPTYSRQWESIKASPEFSSIAQSAIDKILRCRYIFIDDPADLEFMNLRISSVSSASDGDIFSFEATHLRPFKMPPQHSAADTLTYIKVFDQGPVCGGMFIKCHNQENIPTPLFLSVAGSVKYVELHTDEIIWVSNKVKVECLPQTRTNIHISHLMFLVLCPWQRAS